MATYSINQRIEAYNAANYCFEEDFVFLNLLLLSKNNKRKRTHKLYKKRPDEGVVNILIDRDLTDNEIKFRENYRLNSVLFSKVLSVINEDLEGIPTSWNRKPMSSHYKLCITLRYLATGESFRSLAFQYKAHHSTIGRIVTKCLQSIITHFLDKAIPKPTTKFFKKVIEDFFLKWNFPNCCGAIGGKHIRIKGIQNPGSDFFNYKDFDSMVLLAIVDANCKFIAVDVGSYGKEGDADIFIKSEMGKLINDNKFNIPPLAVLPSTNVVVPNVLIGDEAFDLTNKIMTPYPSQQSLYDGSKTLYNHRHCRAKRMTENAFGIMSSYFRVFFTRIQAKPEKMKKIILASCILHNLMREAKIPSPSETTLGNTGNITLPSENFIALSNTIEGPTSDGVAIREKFKEYFKGDGVQCPS